MRRLHKAGLPEAQGFHARDIVAACLENFKDRLEEGEWSNGRKLMNNDQQNALDAELVRAEGDLLYAYGLLEAENRQMKLRINTPELYDFVRGVVSEAQHQRERWGSEHDAGKLPEDWFWLLGYLGGKCLAALKQGDKGKALHHMISTSAALANWHAAILGQTDMRPGLSEEATKRA